MLLSTLRIALAVSLFMLVQANLFAQGTVAKLDLKNGFKDAKLEANIATFSHLVEERCGSKEEPYIKCYTRTTDVLTVGTAALDKIQYNFYKGALGIIAVTVKGRNNIVAIGEALEAAYGPGRRPYEDSNYVQWVGERMTMHIEVEKDDSKKEPVLTLVMISKAQKARSKSDRVEDRKTALQKAVDDL